MHNGHIWLGGLIVAVATILSVGADAQEVSTTKTSPRTVSTAHFGPVETANPILFVTQVPNPHDLNTLAATFANHITDPAAAVRGGDLWIRYPKGKLRNLTKEAGFGTSGFQGANAVAVREPAVHWSGQKALFSMVVGSAAPAGPDQDPGTTGPWFWQLYEVTGLGPNETVVITKVVGQPEDASNTSPIYDSNDRVLFTSDRPRNGAAHLYPQLDEYEMAPTTTGIWRLDTQASTLEILNHLPSGAFNLSIDSDGRIIFTRWDHLERDQQKHLFDMGSIALEPFNWSDESAASVPLNDATEYFPEPQPFWVNFINANPGYVGDLAGYKPELVGHTIDIFLPWQMNQDGTEEETVNHIGRQELTDVVSRVRKDDPAIVNSDLAALLSVDNKYGVRNILQMREDPLNPGTFLAVNAPGHRAHASGQLIRINGFAAGDNPNQTTVDSLSAPDTFGGLQTPDHTGRYRNPVPLSNGLWIASHSAYPGWDANIGTPTAPVSLYDFRLAQLEQVGQYWRAGAKLTPGLSKSIQYYDGTQFVSWSGKLWEMEGVELVARPTPPATAAPASPPAPEMVIFNVEDVDMTELVTWLKANDLAMIVSRNMTVRDANDRQQPYNLRVEGGAAETIGSPGDTVYDVSNLQIFQADQLRSAKSASGAIMPGRRVLATPLSDPLALSVNVTSPTSPAGAVAIADDGSMAAVVPARRALTWQTVDDQGEEVVRERFWLTFQPGEIRTCHSCHGLNEADQAGGFDPQNPPRALQNLITNLRAVGAIQ